MRKKPGSDNRWGPGRREPYTEIGIRRMPCARCGKPARFQWQICADDRLFRTLCAECDVTLNEMVMRWVWGDRREADIARYREKVDRS
jgi:hypothetical protein